MPNYYHQILAFLIIKTNILTTDEMMEPDKAQEMSTEVSPSGQLSSCHVDPLPAHADTPTTTHHLDLEGNRQSCPPDQSRFKQTGIPIAPLLPPSEKGSAKDGSKDPVTSEPSNHNISQPIISLNVDVLCRADKSSSKDCSSSMVQCSEGLSVSETSSVYGAENDPRAAGKGKGEVGVQQTLCTPEARHPQSPDKTSDGQPVAPALVSACTEPQPQTPAASTFPKAGESENVTSAPKTDQASQFSCDESVKVTAPTQVVNTNNNTDVAQCSQTPVSQSQQPAESSSSLCLDQPQNDLPHLSLQSNNGLSICVPEPKDLHSQTVECSPVTVQNVEAVQWVNPEKHVPAVTADGKCTYASVNMGSPELFPPTSSAVEADPPQATGPSVEPCSSDSEKHHGHIPADAPVTPPTSTTSVKTGGEERSPSRAVESHGGAQGTKSHRSSFEWGEALAKSPQLMMSLHGAEGSPGVTQGSAVCTVSAAAPGPAVSEHRSATPQRRFLEIPSAFSAPIFQPDRLNKRGECLMASRLCVIVCVCV